MEFGRRLRRQLPKRLICARLHLSRVRRVRGPPFGKSQSSSAVIAAPSSGKSPPKLVIYRYKNLAKLISFAEITKASCQ